MREVDCDVIVIGSGIGGLTFASAAANRGYKVIIFEAGMKPGGYCQSFTRKGFRFESSVHKIGGGFQKYLIDSIISEIGCHKEKLEWNEFPEYLQVGSLKLDKGNPQLKEIIKQQFPYESDNIDRFFDEMNNLLRYAMSSEKNRNNIGKFDLSAAQRMFKYLNMTSEELLSYYFKDNKLKEFFLALSDGYSNLFGMVMIVYMLHISGNKTYLPMGGMEAVIDRMIDIVKKNGGQLILNSTVSKIIIENNRAVGVMVGGKEYYSRYVVSNIDIRSTYQELIGFEHIPPAYANKLINEWTPVSSCFSTWLGLDCELKHLGHPGGEIISYYPIPGRISDMKSDLIKDGGVLPEDHFIFAATSANLDPTSNPKGRSQVVIGIPISAVYEDNWGLQEKRRGTKYIETKKRISDKLIKTTEQIIPGISQHIDVIETASPLTFERYTRNRGGSYLGYFVSPKFFRDKMRPNPKGMVPGLFISSMWCSIGGGVLKVALEAMRGVDMLLKDDKREDLYNFEERYFYNYF